LAWAVRTKHVEHASGGQWDDRPAAGCGPRGDRSQHSRTRCIGIDDGFVRGESGTVSRTKKAAERAPDAASTTSAAATGEPDATAATVARLYPEVYLLLHRRSGGADERLTPQSQALLQHLTYSGPLTISELAQHLGRAQSVISETIDALERWDLVVRMRDNRDRRRNLVWLTPGAEKLLARLREVLDHERLATAVGAMSAPERAALVAGLTALVRAGERAARRKERKS